MWVRSSGTLVEHAGISRLGQVPPFGTRCTPSAARPTRGRASAVGIRELLDFARGGVVPGGPHRPMTPLLRCIAAWFQRRKRYYQVSADAYTMREDSGTRHDDDLGHRNLLR